MVVVAISLSVIACEDPEPGVGLQLSADGTTIVVHYKPCDPSARVFGIQLTSDDEILYKTTSAAGQSLRTFTLGETPEGFEEETSLRNRLPEGSVRLSLHTSEVPDEYINFDMGDLRRDELLVRYRGYMTTEEFDQRSACDKGGLFG